MHLIDRWQPIDNRHRFHTHAGDALHQIDDIAFVIIRDQDAYPSKFIKFQISNPSVYFSND